MKRKFSYSMKEMNYRLLMMGRPIWKYIGISTLASTIGALSHMGLMGFGALWLLAAAGFCDGAGIYAALTADHLFGDAIISMAFSALMHSLSSEYSISVRR